MPDLPNKRIPPPLPGGIKPPMKSPGIPGSAGAKPPMFPGQAPALPGAKPPFGSGFKGSLPGLPGANAPASAMEDRLRKMEDHAREIEESKKKLEKALTEMELKLKDEKEKALAQAIKAREEESLSLKMEQALKEMQDKARVARREQEMEEARARAEEKAKDLERRLNEEREAWVINLKKQMELRDHETRQVEGQIETRFHDLEKRWLEERSGLLQSLKAKEEEVLGLKQGLEQAAAESRRSKEDSFKFIEQERMKMAYEQESRQNELLKEKESIALTLEQRERELLSLKAQLAMVDSQVRMAQESSQKSLNEKERAWQLQIGELDREFLQLKQTRDQMQADMAKVMSENENLRRDLQDAKNASESVRQKVNELRFELARKMDERDALAKELFADRQTWSSKLEERVLIERNLQEAVNARESELGRVKSAMASLESKLKEQFDKERKEVNEANLRLIREKEQSAAVLSAQLTSTLEQQKVSAEKEKNVMRFDLQNKIAERDREIAALKLESSQTRSEMFSQFEREKAAQAASAKQQFQQELALRTELIQKELDDAHRSTLSNLDEFRKKAESEEARHQKEMRDKDIELARSHEVIRKLEEEIMEEKQERAKGQSAVETRFAGEISRLQDGMNQLKVTFREEKEMLEQQLRNREHEVMDLRAEIERNKEKALKEAAPSILVSEEPPLGLGQRIWKYLTRTVIVINFKGVPRKFKEDSEENNKGEWQ